MGLKCNRHCINQVESVCNECDNRIHISKSELLVDYCQRCGAEVGSFECCQSSTNAFYRGTDRYGNDGLFEDFEQSIGE